MDLKKNFVIAMICLLPLLTVQAQSVVINRVFKGTVGEAGKGQYDAIELLVVEDHVDMRNWIIKDYANAVTNEVKGDFGGKFRFKDVALWKNLRSGTTIVLRQPGGTFTANPSPGANYIEDTDASDFTIDLNIRNTTYFRAFASPFPTIEAPTSYVDRTFMLNDANEIVLLRWDDGFGEGMGAANAVHAFAYGNVTATSHYTGITSPKLHIATTPAKGAYLYAKSENKEITDFATVTGVSKDKAPPIYVAPANNNESLAQKIKNNTTLVKSITSESIRHNYPGVKEAYITYVNPSDKNITLYILDIDLSDPKLSIEVGTKNDAPSVTGAQTVMDMIPKKNQNSFEKQVIAGINGDYFSYANGVFTPNYSVIKNGVILRDVTDAPTYKHFGQLDNKTYQIGDDSAYLLTKPRFIELIGGKIPLVWNGILTNEIGEGQTRARTSIGLVNNKRAIILVVDEAHANSVGYSLPQLGQVMKALGAVNAVNLDGGGSSTFIVREANGQYQIKNLPSDPGRVVSNALFLMRKTD